MSPGRSSLKGYTPALSRLLGMTPVALYERQRALVRAGLLETEEGRGPGSGVRSSSGAISLLLIAVLATDRLSETEARAKAIGAAKPFGRKYCSLTRQPHFTYALASVLYNTGLADTVISIDVSRSADRARIRYWDRDPGKPFVECVSEFVGQNGTEPGLSISACLNQPLLQEIARDVQAITMEELEQ